MIKVKCTSKEGYVLTQFTNSIDIMSVLRDLYDLELGVFVVRSSDVDLSDNDIVTYLHSTISSAKEILTIPQIHHIEALKAQLDCTHLSERMKTNIVLCEIYLVNIVNKKAQFKD